MNKISVYKKFVIDIVLIWLSHALSHVTVKQYL